MSDSTGIEWTDATWNPVVGCSHVSPGCDHCYAAREASGRLRGVPAYEGLAVDGRFTGEVRVLPERFDQPLRWRRPRRVFVNSMSDLFHRDVDFETLVEVFRVMAACPQHTFQVLTKRPKRMAGLVPDALAAIGNVDVLTRQPIPLPNVWLGTSIETQPYANLRLPHLAATPAAVRFVSAEPLLSPVYISPEQLRSCGIGWVIVGGESGPGARPMHPAWARDLRDQCVDAGVPFLFKQWGEWGPYQSPSANPGPHEWLDLGRGDALRRVGKRAAGRVLDGRTWDQYPEPRP